MFSIYVAHNQANDKMYVGQTNRHVEKRWCEHVYDAKRRDGHLYNAINKYHSESFSVLKIGEADSEEKANELEQLWVLILGTHDKNVGYNKTFGGRQFRLVEESRRKLSQSLKGKVASNKGRKSRPETCEKLRKLFSGENNPFFGKSHSDEQKAKWRVSRKGKSPSRSSIEKSRLARKGIKPWNSFRPWTEEQKSNLSGPRPHTGGQAHYAFNKSASTESIRQLRSIGFTYPQIAKTVGCSYATVQSRLKAWGYGK